MTTFLTMLLTALIMTLIYDSGFFEEMDKRVNKAFPLHHLPYPFHCCFCGTWWILVLLMIITHTLTIPYILLALVLARLTPVFSNIITLVEATAQKLISVLMRHLDEE